MPKKTRIYELHMKSRFKKRSALLGRLPFKRAFLFRKVKAFYRVGIRLRESYLLYLPNQHQKQNNAPYEHHHAAVIAILLDIGDYNVLIAIVIGFKYQCNFGRFKMRPRTDVGRRCAARLCARLACGLR